MSSILSKTFIMDKRDPINTLDKKVNKYFKEEHNGVEIEFLSSNTLDFDSSKIGLEIIYCIKS